MNAIMFDGPTIPAIPLARMVGRFALLLAFAALYGLSPALALPLLGAAESFVIPGSSSATHAGATSSKGDPGVGTGNSNTGATSGRGDPGSGTGNSNTGATSGRGDLGVSTGTSVTGSATRAFSLPGSLHNSPPNDVASQRAQEAGITADNVLNVLPCGFDETEINAGKLTLTLRLNCVSTTAGLNGTPALSARGDPVTLSVPRIGSGPTTEASSFPGTPDAVTDIIFSGRGFNGGIERFENARAPGGIPFGLSESISAVPEPSTLALFGFGLAGFGLARRRRAPAFQRITSSA